MVGLVPTIHVFAHQSCVQDVDARHKGEHDGPEGFMLTIWGRLSSINVQKVVWAAGEAEQAFERIDVGGPFGGLDTLEFAAMNPNRQIPVLRDGRCVAVMAWYF